MSNGRSPGKGLREFDAFCSSRGSEATLDILLVPERREERIGAVQIPWADTLASTIGNAWVHFEPNVQLYDLTSLYLAQNPWARPYAKAAGVVAGAFPGTDLALGANYAATGAPDNGDEPF